MLESNFDFIGYVLAPSRYVNNKEEFEDYEIL